MLDGVRIVLTGYTASFRVPSFVGHQLTLPVPPLSTVYGLLSAAAERWVEPDDLPWLSFRCQYESKVSDLEAIYQFTRDREKAVPKLKPYPKTRTVLQREFLAMPRLVLYLPSQWEALFRRPRYAILLGRTQDVGCVESITSIALQTVEAGEVSGVLLPLEVVTENNVPAWLHNLPIAFTQEPNRRLMGMGVFGALDARRRPVLLEAPEWLMRDTSDDTIVPVYYRDWVLNVLHATIR